MTDPAALIAHFAAAASEPVTLPEPASEVDAELRRLRREAQVRLNVEGLPRGLRVAA